VDLAAFVGTLMKRDILPDAQGTARAHLNVYIQAISETLPQPGHPPRPAADRLGRLAEIAIADCSPPIYDNLQAGRPD